MADGRVLVVGEALVDVRMHGQGRTEHPGGSPLNVAVGLARLGVATTLATQVGDDLRGAAVTAHMEASGVELLRLLPHHDTAVATVHLGDDGSATYEFDIDWDPVRLPDPAGFRLVHVGSIGATLAPGATAVVALVEQAAAAGVPVSIDPNLRPSITPDVDRARSLVEQMIGLSTVVKLSDADAGVLWPGAGSDTVVSALTAAAGSPLVALTCGPEGALLGAERRRARVQAPAVTVADTIGAGDSFMSALLAGLLTLDLLAPDAWTEHTLGWLGGLSVAASAVTCGRAGADPPWRTELAPLVKGPGRRAPARA